MKSIIFDFLRNPIAALAVIAQLTIPALAGGDAIDSQYNRIDGEAIYIRSNLVCVGKDSDTGPNDTSCPWGPETCYAQGVKCMRMGPLFAIDERALMSRTPYSIKDVWFTPSCIGETLWNGSCPVFMIQYVQTNSEFDGRSKEFYERGFFIYEVGFGVRAFGIVHPKPGKTEDGMTTWTDVYDYSAGQPILGPYWDDQKVRKW